MNLDSDLLALRIDDWRCAFPLVNVSEIMRPLRCDALADAPPYVTGLAMIRGLPTPVIDLCRLLAGQATQVHTRLVTVKINAARLVAVQVSQVYGIFSRHRLQVVPLPPLLEGNTSEHLAELGRLDEDLLRVLHVSRLVPDGVWAHIGEHVGEA